MKKLYTLAAVAAMSIATAMAATELPLTAANQGTAVLEKTTAPAPKAAKASTLLKSRHKLAQASIEAAPAELTPRKAVKAAAPSEDEWEYLGEAKFVDGFLLMAYQGPVSDPYDVPAYKSKTKSNTYLLQNIYPTSYLAEFNLYEQTNGLESSVTLTYTDPSKVQATFDINLTDLTDDSKVSVVQVPNANISYNSGTFTFAEESYLIYYDDQAYAYNGTFTISLPGAADLSLTFTTEDGICTPDNKISFTLGMGADAKGLKFFYTQGTYLPSAGNLNVVLQGGQNVAAGNYSLNLTDAQAGWYTLFACTVSQEGTVGQGGALYFYVQPAFDESAWYSLGEVDFTDDTFLPLFGVNDIYTYKVQLYEDKTTEGRFCLVDPYDKHPMMTENWSNHGHQHMLYVSAEQADAVSIALQPLGVLLFDSDFSLESYQDGTLTNGKITFPTKGLLTVDKNLDAYYANQKGKFAIEVPDLVTVTVTCNGAPVADAFVNYTDWSGEGVYTDASGVAYMPVKAGTTELMAYKDGYDMTTFTFEGLGRHKTATAELTEAMASLTVMVFDEEDEPVSGATVSVKDMTATTNASGSAVFAEIPAPEVIGTTVAVAVTAEGYKDWAGEADFTESMEAYVMATLEKDDTQTSLSTVKVTEAKADTIFDLKGRRVSKPGAGTIVIINGKKAIAE